MKVEVRFCVDVNSSRTNLNELDPNDPLRQQIYQAASVAVVEAMFLKPFTVNTDLGPLTVLFDSEVVAHIAD